MRHDKAVAILDDLTAVAAQRGCTLGYEVHHDEQEPETKALQQSLMLAHWSARLARYDRQGHKGAAADRAALPRVGDDYLLLEVLSPGTTARVVRVLPLETLLGNSSKQNVAFVEAMCLECKRRH